MKLTPFKVTIITPILWFLIAFIYLNIGESRADTANAIVFGSIYLAPFITLLAYVISIIMNKGWLKENKFIGISLFALLLLWGGAIVYHVVNLNH